MLLPSLSGADPAVRRPGRRAALAAALALLVAALTALVLSRSGRPVGPDLALHRWTAAHRSGLLTTLALVVTATGSGPPAYLLAAVAGALGRSRAQRVRGAVTAVAALLTGQLLRLAGALAVGRDRPPLADRAGSASGPSFPSGHTTTSALVAVLLCLAVVRLTTPGSRRTAWCAVALGWAAAVGLTRVYLGVHWPSDVLGGWLLAGALALAADALAGWWGRRART